MSSQEDHPPAATRARRATAKKEPTMKPSTASNPSVKPESKRTAVTKQLAPSFTSASPGRKRKYEEIDCDSESKKKVKAPSPEKRLRRFRPNPTINFEAVYDRSRTQRFYVLSRKRNTTTIDDGNEIPEEEVELAGTTGNVYKVTIARTPTCTCPHARSGHQCKHMIYVMDRVLRAKFEYVYQLALLSTELKEIFEKSPPPEAEAADTKNPKNRKPIEGDCPICYSEFEEQEKQGNAIVWCRAACGQNVHRTCFQTWASTKCPGRESEATCPYCRSVWGVEEDLTKRVRTDGPVNAEGYVNVADQLGISRMRDTSSYHWGWGGSSSWNRPRWRGGSRGRRRA